MDFHNLYAHGFARVAAATLPIAMVQPEVNAAAILEQARELDAEGVALAVFPELCLTGYSIEDLLLQDVVLDAADAAVASIVEGSADLGTVLVVGAPLRSLHRIYNCAIVIHRGQILGVVPKSYLPTYREFYERRQIAPGDDVTGEIRVAGVDVPFGPDLLFAAEDVPGLVIHAEVCEDPLQPGGAGDRDPLFGPEPVRDETRRRLIDDGSGLAPSDIAPAVPVRDGESDQRRISGHPPAEEDWIAVSTVGPDLVGHLLSARIHAPILVPAPGDDHSLHPHLSGFNDDARLPPCRSRNRIGSRQHNRSFGVTRWRRSPGSVSSWMLTSASTTLT